MMRGRILTIWWQAELRICSANLSRRKTSDGTNFRNW